MKLNLAIISPNQNAYSETFIQAHRNLDANIFFYYGGFLPTHLENEGKIIHKDIQYTLFLIKKRLFKNSSINFHEKCLIDSFKKNNIQLVLAEYGPSGAEVLNVCKALNIPLIVHFHGFDASEHKILSNYRSKYIGLFQYANHVISVSSKMTQDLIHLGCPESKIIYNVYGPNSIYFDIERKSPKNQFISVGRFVDKKAPHLTIEAFKNVVTVFPSVKLIMCGDGYLLQTCKHLVNLWGLQNNVIFKGAVKPLEVMELFSESIAFVQHSIIAHNGDSEGTPVAILEASASGLAVLSTFHAGIPDVIIHGKTGFLVEEQDVDGMANKMLLLLENNELAFELGNNGKEYIKKNFTLERHLDVLNDLFKSTF
jgi:colanic acid/amylovoran biosynthesis glycosyltransferase